MKNQRKDNEIKNEIEHRSSGTNKELIEDEIF